MSGKVVHCKKSSYDIYIGRGSKWGNPYSHKLYSKAKYLVKTREEAILKYEEYIRNNEELLNDLHELRNKTLGCFCHPLPCHGDILLKLIEERFDYDDA